MKKLVIILICLIAVAGVVYGSNPCNGVTVNGTPCKIAVSDSTNYCRFHNPASPRCGYLISAGKGCKIVVQTIGDSCQIHGRKETVK